MKKAPIYILLFLYTAVQLKPLTVVLQDVIAHTFFKMQHMATVHYENGHYHLHQQLKSISETDQGSSTQKNPASEKTNETSSSQQLTELNFNFNIRETSVSFYPVSGSGLLKGFPLSNFRPPSLV